MGILSGSAGGISTPGAPSPTAGRARASSSTSSTICWLVLFSLSSSHSADRLRDLAEARVQVPHDEHRLLIVGTAAAGPSRDR